MLFPPTPFHLSLLHVERAVLLRTGVRQRISSRTPSLPPEEDTLRILPPFNTGEEKNRSDDHNSPLPSNHLVLEDNAVDNRNVKRRENRNKTDDDSPEKELIPSDIIVPLREVLLTPRLHAEEAPLHIDQLPSEEQREPGKAGEASCSSSEYSVAFGRVSFVAAFAEVAVAEAEEDDGESAETQCCDPEAVHEHIQHDFQSEDAPLERLWRAVHDIWSGDFEAETHVWQSRSDHDDLGRLVGAR